MAIEKSTAPTDVPRNPLIQLDSHGCVDLRETLDEVARLTHFLESFHCMQSPFEEGTFSSGLVIIQTMILDAVKCCSEHAKPSAASHG